MLEFDRLIEAAFAKLGSTSNLDLAKAIGLSGDHRSQRVARWRSKNAADYEGTIKLLEYVGWLRDPAEAARAEAAPSSSTGVSEQTVRALRSLLAEAAGLLEVAADELDPPSASPGRRGRAARARDGA